LVAPAGLGFSVPTLAETNTSEAFGALIRNVTRLSEWISGEMTGSGRDPLGIWESDTAAIAANRKVERRTGILTA
jgi:hypothetical protein